MKIFERINDETVIYRGKVMTHAEYMATLMAEIRNEYYVDGYSECNLSTYNFDMIYEDINPVSTPNGDFYIKKIMGYCEMLEGDDILQDYPDIWDLLDDIDTFSYKCEREDAAEVLADELKEYGGTLEDMLKDWYFISSHGLVYELD